MSSLTVHYHSCLTTLGPNYSICITSAPSLTVHFASVHSLVTSHVDYCDTNSSSNSQLVHYSPACIITRNISISNYFLPLQLPRQHLFSLYSSSSLSPISCHHSKKFRPFAPLLWNFLPPDLHRTQSLHTFNFIVTPYLLRITFSL